MRFDEFIRFYLVKKDPDAVLWTLSYFHPCHCIDDIIDQDIPKDKKREQFMLQTFEFTEAVFSNNFYIQNITRLRPLVKIVAQSYMDSVRWEDDKEQWKRQLSDALRLRSSDVLLAVIEIVCGLETRWEASPKLREIAWKDHHKEDGTPI